MKRLPDSIGALKNLSTLSLARNQLEYLPTSLKHLADLKYIDVHVNCLHTILPEEIFSEWERKTSEGEAQAVFVDTSDSPATPATPATPMTPATPNTPSTPSRRFRRHKSLHAQPAQEQFSRLFASSDVILPKGGIVLLSGLRDLECSYNELSELPDLSEMVRIAFVWNRQSPDSMWFTDVSCAAFSCFALAPSDFLFVGLFTCHFLDQSHAHQRGAQPFARSPRSNLRT